MMNESRGNARVLGVSLLLGLRYFYLLVVSRLLPENTTLVLFLSLPLLPLLVLFLILIVVALEVVLMLFHHHHYHNQGVITPVMFSGP